MRADLPYFLLTLLFMCCCSSGIQTRNEVTNHDYTSAFENKLGINYRTLLNSDSTFLIAYTYHKDKSKIPGPPLKFLIYSLQEDSILFEDNLANGNIKWINKSQVEVTTTPEVIKYDGEKEASFTGYIYDVELQKKLKPRVINK